MHEKHYINSGEKLTLTVEAIHQWQDFPFQEWDALVQASHRHSVFLTSAWLTAAWSFLAANRQLHILLLRDNQTLVGGLMLAEETEYWRRMPVRKLVLLTDPVTTCVRSDLVVPENEIACAKAIQQYLFDHKQQWDLLHLDSLPASSPLLKVSELQAKASIEPYWILHRLEIEGTWESFMANHPQHLRDHLRRERNKLEKLGQLETEFAETPVAINNALNTFFAIEARSGKQDRDDYTRLEGKLKAYYQTLFHNLAQSGHALIATLKLNGLPIASILAARIHQTIYTLNDVFDLQYRKQYAGHYLRGEIIRHSYTQGYLAVDFNGYGAHIQRWRTTGHPQYRLIAYSPSRYGAWLSFYKQKIVPVAHQLLPALFSTTSTPAKSGDRGIEDIAEQEKDLV